jgi:hypothetical protein
VHVLMVEFKSGDALGKWETASRGNHLAHPSLWKFFSLTEVSSGVQSKLSLSTEQLHALLLIIRLRQPVSSFYIYGARRGLRCGGLRPDSTCQ